MQPKSRFLSGFWPIPLWLILHPMVYGQDTVQESMAFGKLITIERTFPDSTIDGYGLYVPNSCTTDSRPFPVLVFLQGSGSVGKEISSIYRWALPKYIKQVKNLNSDLSRLMADSFIVVMPHLSDGQYYENEKAITSLLEEVVQKYNGDIHKIYLTGLSRGGHGTWGLASRMPGYFAAIVPVCGTPKGVTSYDGFKTIPVFAVHNQKDPIVPVSGSIQAIENMERVQERVAQKAERLSQLNLENADLILLTPKSRKHDAWSKIYRKKELYHWLLRFSLQG